MSVRFELPHSLEARLRRDLGDLEETAKAATLAEVYRQGKISLHDLSEALGYDRFETMAFLKRLQVFDGAISHDDVDADRRTLDEAITSDKP